MRVLFLQCHVVETSGVAFVPWRVRATSFVESVKRRWGRVKYDDKRLVSFLAL